MNGLEAYDIDELIDVITEQIARGDAYMALAESLIDYGDGMRIWPGDEGRGRPFSKGDVAKFRRAVKQRAEG